MKLLQEILTRNEWLELQQRLVELGFDAELIPDMIVFTGSYGSRLFKGRVMHLTRRAASTGANGFIVANMERPVRDTVETMEAAVEAAAQCFLEHITAGNDECPDDLDWLEPKQAMDFVERLLDGKKYKLVSVAQGLDQAMVKHFEKEGWTLFLNSDGEVHPDTGENVLVFLK